MRDLHDPGLVAALAEGRLEGEERQRVITHLSECSECRRTLAALGRAIEDGTLGERPRVAASRGPRFTQPRVWLPLAASVLIASFAWFRFAGTPGDEGVQPIDESVLVTRGAGRVIDGKTFRLIEGQWVDAGFDPAAGLPAVVIQGAEERANLLDGIPALAPYTGLGDRVTVVWQGTVYRFEP